MENLDLGNKEALTSEIREYLFSLICQFPGLYFRQIVNRSELSIGTIDYNMRVLKKNRLVTDELILGKKRYFTFSLEPEERKLMGLLREQIIRKIIDNILSQGYADYKSLTHTLELSKSTISWYLSRLKTERLIKSEISGKKKVYMLENREKIEKLVKKYNETFSDKLLSNFISMWEH